MHSAYQTQHISGPYGDTGYTLQGQGRVGLPVAQRAPERPPRSRQDPSQFNIDRFAQPGPSTAGSPVRNKPRDRPAATKRTGTCARCRRLKMKCTFNQNEQNKNDICLRCTAGGTSASSPSGSPAPRRAAQQVGQRFMSDDRTKFDISALEDIAGMSENKSDTNEDPALAQAEGTTSLKCVGLPKAYQGARASKRWLADTKEVAEHDADSGIQPIGSLSPQHVVDMRTTMSQLLREPLISASSSRFRTSSICSAAAHSAAHSAEARSVVRSADAHSATRSTTSNHPAPCLPALVLAPPLVRLSCSHCC